MKNLLPPPPPPPHPHPAYNGKIPPKLKPKKGGGGKGEKRKRFKYFPQARVIKFQIKHKLYLKHLPLKARLASFRSSYNIKPRYLPLTIGGRVNSRVGQGHIETTV